MYFYPRGLLREKRKTIHLINFQPCVLLHKVFTPQLNKITRYTRQTFGENLMNFSNFRFEIKKHITNASAGIFEAFVCGDGQGLFEYQDDKFCITYRNGQWTYSFRGTIGVGASLPDAISSEETAYNKVWLAQLV